MKKAKNIHLSAAVIKKLTLMAIENDMVFKTYVEAILEDISNKKGWLMSKR